MPRILSQTTLLALAAMITGCPDQSLTAFNADPSATITSPEDGTEVQEGSPVSLRGSLSDPDDSNDSLVATWYLGDDIVCPETAADWDGATSCEMVLSAEDEVVTLEVKDPQGAAGADSISLVVVATDAPDAEIISPEAGGVYYSDRLITFEGTVSDSEDAPTDLTAWWESNIDGELNVDAEPDTSGGVLGSGYLNEGEHSIELRVEDTTGKAGQDNVVITVGPPNTAPQCQISAPENGAVGQEGELVTFEAEVSDVDVPSDWLTVTWESDKDGELGSSSPNSDGSVTFAWSDLSVDTHTVTMRVSDEVGATCTDSVLYTVGTAPEVTLTSPGEGEVVNDGESVGFSAGVSDNEDSPTDLALSWASDLDGTISTQGADSSGVASFDISSLSTGEHTVTLTVTDTDGLYSTDRVSFTVNALPTAPTVSISPDPAYTDDALVATASGSVDPDASGTVTYSYAWYESGVLSSASSTATFPASATTKGLIYRVVVTPSDGTGAGDAGEAELTIGNTEPVVGTPVISPSSGVTTSEVLTCSASATDADGDTPTVTYAWSNSTTGASLGSGASLTLTPTTASPGDVVACEATAMDDGGATDSDSASVTVENTDPMVDSVVISPSTGVTTSETLTCTATASDDDGGSPSLTYSWSSGSTSLGMGSSLTLAATTSAPGDSITCTATATDADGGSISDSVSVTVENTDPVLDSVVISPSTGVTTSETLACTATASDGDGGSPSLDYAWSNGSTSLGTGSSLTLTPTTSAPGDSITCTAEATDAHGGSASDSASVSVVNSAPSIASVSIDPDPVYAADALTCSYSGFSDPDGDADVSSYAWTVGSVEAGSASTLSGAFVGGDSVACTVTPSDGTDTGTPVSDSLLISNTPPSLDDVTLSPSPAYEGDTLTCTPGSYADDDGDTVMFTYAWDVEGVDPGETSTTLSATWFDRGETVTCTITPNDGTDDGAAVASNSITISNSAPSITSVSISPTSPTADDSLTCSYGGYSDADSDPDSSTSAWTVDGVAAGSGSTLSGAFSSGDVVVCTVTPHDGTDAGAAMSDSVTVQNEPPMVDSVSLSPTSVYTNDTITATVSTSDPDGDTVTVGYAWYVDGALVSETGGSLAGATWFDKDQVVYVVVTPNDGTDDGPAVTSSSLTVLNTAPEAPVVSIDPAEPVEGVDDLVCVIDAESSDDDGDSISYTFAWTVDGATWTGSTSTTYEAGDTVTGATISAGDEWTCTVTPNDGDEDGTSAVASVTASAGPSVEVDVGNAEYKMIGEEYYAYAGQVVAGGTDITGDGRPDLVIAAPYADSTDSHSGTIFVVDELTSGDNYLADFTLQIHGKESGSVAGSALSVGGDVNGDGYQDLAIGSPYQQYGAAYIVFGPVTAESTLGDHLPFILGDNMSEYLGMGLSIAYDFTADGNEDLIVAARGDDSCGVYTGAVYIFDSPSAGEFGPTDAFSTFLGTGAMQSFGGSVAGVDDFDGDGVPDLAITASGYPSAYPDPSQGSALVFQSPLVGTYAIDDADAFLIGEEADIITGVCDAGDTNSDGYSDIVVASYIADRDVLDVGVAYLVLGPVSGAINLTDADAVLEGVERSDCVGTDIDSAGDADADGFDDFLIGAYQNGTDTGMAFLFYGPVSGQLDYDSARATFIGESTGWCLGVAVEGIGDYDGDGYDDFLLGDPFESTGETAAGAAYLVLGESY